MIPLNYRSRRVVPETPTHPGELGQIFRYASMLAACWFLLSGGVIYVVIDIFNYVNGVGNFSLRSLGISLGVLVLTMLVGMSLYVLRPRA